MKTEQGREREIRVVCVLFCFQDGASVAHGYPQELPLYLSVTSTNRNGHVLVTQILNIKMAMNVEFYNCDRKQHKHGGLAVGQILCHSTR